MAILTVSREFGSDGEEIARTIAHDMGYILVDRKIILDDMKQAGKQWGEYGEQFDERSPSLWERHDWSFRGYVALSQSIILEYAAKDNVVLIGRGGNFLLKGMPHALRVRITMPTEERIQKIIKRDDVNHDTAKWLVEKVDSEMSRHVHFIYGKDWNEPAEYDAVYNRGTTSKEEIVTAIKAALVKKETLKTDEARKALRLRSVAAKVKAGIATNPKFLLPTLEVEPQGTGIILRGVTHNPKEHARIEEEAKKLAGDVPVICALHYR